MTPTTLTARTRETTARTQTAPSADALLRDVAFVLQMTRRVKDEMHGGRPTPRAGRPVNRVAERVAVMA